MLNSPKLDTSAWGEFEYIQPLNGGYRNLVYLLKGQAGFFVLKTTRRSEAAIRWLCKVYECARQAGLVVPKFIKSKTGNFIYNGATLETFISGQQVTPEQLVLLPDNLQTFHYLTRQLLQRPGFASSLELLSTPAGGDVDLSTMPPEIVKVCRSIWSNYQNKPLSVIHGDINPSNILITPEGKLALLDWDESRLDLSLFDELALARTLGKSLSHSELRLLDSWETAVCWHIEPEHALNIGRTLL